RRIEQGNIARQGRQGTGCEFVDALVGGNRAFFVSRCYLNSPFCIESLGIGWKSLGEVVCRCSRVLPVLLQPVEVYERNLGSRIIRCCGACAVYIVLRLRPVLLLSCDLGEAQ